MAPTHASLAAGDSLLELPDVALTLAAAEPCASIRVAPATELLARLELPGTGDLRVNVDTSDATSGCKLRVEVFREGDDSAASTPTVFDIAAAVSENASRAITAAAGSSSLRGASGSLELSPERLWLKAPSASYDVVLRGATRSPVPASSLVLYGTKCAPALLDAARVQRSVVPSGVDAGALALTQSRDVAAANGRALDCFAVLDVSARAPLLLADAADALGYARAFDAQLADAFAAGGARVVAAVELHGASAALASAAGGELRAAAEAAAPAFNAPTKAMTLGVLAGLCALVAMLVGVAASKRRHERRCAERHANASKAAQIRRVSLRMASPARGAFGEEDEEEKFDERDGLL